MTLKGPNISHGRAWWGDVWLGKARGHEQARKRLKLSHGEVRLCTVRQCEAGKGKDTIFYLKQHFNAETPK